MSTWNNQVVPIFPVKPLFEDMEHLVFKKLGGKKTGDFQLAVFRRLSQLIGLIYINLII